MSDPWFREPFRHECRDNHLPLRFESCFAAGVAYDVAPHIVQFCSVSSNEALLRMLSLPRQVGPGTWLLMFHLISVVVGAGKIPVESLEGSNGTLAWMRNSMSSNGAHFGPQFVASHSAFSFSPQLMEASSKVHQGLRLCRCLCQRLFPARLPLSQCFVAHKGNIHLSVWQVACSRHPPFIY